jgi:hypothetical protein
MGQNEETVEPDHFADGFPELAELLTRLLPTPSHHPIGEYNGVHGSGTCAGDADDFDRLVLKHSVEHAPSKGSMRAAPLQSQCNLAGR